MKQVKITDIRGVQIGHAQNEEALTGCTVLLCEDGAVAGAAQRGGAPGTRETDALRKQHLVEQIHAVLLTGGSAFGLDAATGVMRYLEGRGLGFSTVAAVVPVVPAAVIYDLALGRADIRPDAQMGYQACLNASKIVQEGCVGAGTGASVGKILGMGQAVKSGLGAACIELGEGLMIGALMVVNALGDVVDPDTGSILAGARDPVSGQYVGSLTIFSRLSASSSPGFSSRENTVIGAVVTNARLTKEQANMLAEMAHDGIARTVRPAHTIFDGDTIFALATGQVEVNAGLLSVFAAEVVSAAVIRAVQSACSAGGLPSIIASE